MAKTASLSRRFLFLLSSLPAAIFAGCVDEPVGNQNVLRLATTTSTRDSGLLDALVPIFEATHGCRVDIVAVGSGAALKLGEQGDADVLIAHAPQAEEEFMKAGHGTRRESFMYNYYTILGPSTDPAHAEKKQLVEAMQSIALGKHRFVSRGDDSGTHKREIAFWEKIGGRPHWNEYLESGQGMGATLIMADEMQAYVLSDHGTYLNFKNKIDLIPLTEDSESLRNTYSVIAVDSQLHVKINARLADQFVEFVTSQEARRAINEFKRDGQQLFFTTELPSEE